ncbi:MAG TPA: ABC transporter permease [Candidatus Kapabacteria bacterium]|nr:ABC transporter permease [Candidatus Kapabacteria bacterium]
MKIPFIYTFRSLWTRKLTAMMTIAGVGLVVFVFAAVLMLAQGLKDTLVATGSSDNAILLRSSAESETLSSISRDAASILEAMPEVATGQDGKPMDSKECVVIINMNKKGSHDMGNVTVRGLSSAGLAMRPQIHMTEGRMFTPGTSELIVGNEIASRFEGAQIGGQVKFGGRMWTIVGVFDAGKTGFASELIGDVDQVMQAFNRPVYSAMIFRMKSPDDFPAIKAKVEADPRLMDLTVKREKDFYAAESQQLADFISILGTVITIIFSFGAMIGAMITMYAAVANRTVEIGTLRALGFRRRSVLGAFLTESLIIALIGGVAGLLLASSMQLVTISTLNWSSFTEIAFGFSMTPQIVASTIIFALIMGFIGGFLPAARAARLNIINALRAS